MNEEDLFKAIRREDAVIFAGAGFSKYTGYPLAGALGNLIYNQLTPSQQSRITPQWPLDCLTEEVARLTPGSREFLNNILDSVYGAEPQSTEDHDLLATIPHFKTIITTNYDSLFERAYGASANLIFKEADIASWDDHKVNILKIHGDLSDKSSIILTREDYSAFYKKDYSSPFWAAIIKEIATKTILFLGYGFEDSNVWAIFKDVYEHIGNKQKAAYFVGPGATGEKIEFLRSKGINYVDRTAHEFLTLLFRNIEDHIFQDIQDKTVTPETFWKFTKSRNLDVPLADNGSGFRIVSIQGLNRQSMNGHLKFTVDAKSDFHKKHEDFLQNQSEEISLGEQDMKNLRMDVEGLKLFNGDDLQQISFIKIPRLFEFDLYFLKEGLELRNLTAKVYSSAQNVKIQSKIHTLAFQMVFDLTNPNKFDGKWAMEHEQIYHSVSEEIEVFRFLKYFFSQKTATINFKGGGEFSKQCPEFDKNHIRDADNYLKYFEGLRKVELAFGVRFKDFYPIDQESFDDLSWLLKVIHGEKIPKEGTMTMTFGELPPELLSNLSLLKENEKPMAITMNSDSVMSLHGLDLPVQGLLIEIPQPVILNLKELQSGKIKEMRIKSGSGTIYHRYQIEPFPSVQ